jgi:hypothetical protein
MGYVNVTNEVEPTITTTAGAYTAGDVIGGLLDLTELCGGGGGGVIRAVIVSDDADQAVALDLHLFSDKPTEIANGDPFSALPFADLAKRIGKVSIAALDYEEINSNSQAIKSGLAISHGAGTLYGMLVANGSTPTYGASAVVLKLKVIGWKD